LLAQPGLELDDERPDALGANGEALLAWAPLMCKRSFCTTARLAR
jgi:hypothetical protein